MYKRQALYLFKCRAEAWLYPMLALSIVKAVIRYAEYVCIYGLYFKHKCLLAAVSLIPGVSLLCALKAVSYTHLDVYKRQAVMRATTMHNILIVIFLISYICYARNYSK